MRIFDSVMMNDELDMLECRLIELESVPNLVHVIVEADVTHQDVPKPSHLSDNWERFSPWHERIVRVWATNLPKAKPNTSTLVHVDGELTNVNPDPWAREHGQREHTWRGLTDASPDDVVLHGDLDEIPTAVVVRNTFPPGFVAYDQSFHPFAVDWLHPDRWRGTVAARVSRIKSFGAMRDMRNYAPFLPNAGWHFSWVGGNDYGKRKLASFCHPEIADRTAAGLEGDVFYREGWHVDGRKLAPIDGHKLPKYIAERRCPDNWWRP
jgi:hypothetical protein